MKQFTSVRDVSSIPSLIELGLKYKKNPTLDQVKGKGKRVGLLFFNPSLRTRLSSQIAAQNLGMEAIVLNVGQEGWALEFNEGAVMNGASVEHIKDAAPILGAYFDILCLRTFPKLENKEDDLRDQAINAMIRYSKVPVVSLESTQLHPLQSLSDLITIQENWKSEAKPKVVLTWAPHIKPIPQCVANSFSEWMCAWGKADFVISHPPGYALLPQYTEGAQIILDQAQALQGADFVYVKNWSSVEQYGKVLGNYPEWMLTEQSLKDAPQAKVMHCLPLRRNVELSDEVLDGPRSLLTEQATNRIWSAQAVYSEILKDL